MAKQNYTPPEAPAPAGVDTFLRADTCAQAFGIGLSTWWKWVSEGKVEKAIKLGPKTSVWRASYIAQLQDEMTGEAA